MSSHSLSDAQLAANRANAQLSTGPTSAEGKAKASLNAVKTALTGRTVVLASEDAAEYERFNQAYAQEFQPVGQRECDLVQSIADAMWRLRRIPGLELGIYQRAGSRRVRQPDRAPNFPQIRKTAPQLADPGSAPASPL